MGFEYESPLVHSELLSKQIIYQSKTSPSQLVEEGVRFISHCVHRKLYNILQDTQKFEKMYQYYLSDANCVYKIFFSWLVVSIL